MDEMAYDLSGARVRYFVHKTCSRQWHLRDVRTSSFDLTFVLDGHAHYETDEGSFDLESGEAVLVPAGSRRVAHTEGMECAAFNFTLDKPFAPFAEAGCFQWGADEMLNQYFTEFEYQWMSDFPLRMIKCGGLFQLIVHRLLELKQDGGENLHIVKIKRYLLEHYTQTVTVEMAADEAGLNPVYCGALFKRQTGMSILEYLNRLRVSRARALLEYGGARVGEAAQQAGFKDPYYFSRVFTRYVGCSPAEYIRAGMQKSAVLPAGRHED